MSERNKQVIEETKLAFDAVLHQVNEARAAQDWVRLYALVKDLEHKTFRLYMATDTGD